MHTVPETLGIIAGSGAYPATMAGAARRAGVGRIVVAAFVNETNPELEPFADAWEWLKVGHLGKLSRFLRHHGVKNAVMCGQIAPKNLFALSPDFRLLIMLAKLKERNAESLFGGIADELAKDGITLLPATLFLEDHLPPAGHVCGPPRKARELEDAAFGLKIARETSRLDIGQTVVVRRGTVLAVEAFEGTNECIKRGGALGQGKATVVKVSKPGQDFRFDVPVVGPLTIETAARAGVRIVAVEAGRTLLLEREETARLCAEHGVSLIAV
ncbi:MAG: UDP-2,3-diacylglucosamine diphosphatase LpxI [Verrucomicrobiota bacterium]